MSVKKMLFTKKLYLLLLSSVISYSVNGQNFSLDGFEFGRLSLVVHDKNTNIMQLSKESLVLKEGDLVYILSANSKPYSIKYNADNNTSFYDYEYSYALFDPNPISNNVVSLDHYILVGGNGSSFVGPGKLYAMSFYDSQLRKFWNSYSSISYAILRKDSVRQRTHIEVPKSTDENFEVNVESSNGMSPWTNIMSGVFMRADNERYLRFTVK